VTLLDPDGQLLDRSINSPDSHRNSRHIERRIVNGAPLPGLAVDDELPS
jgi:hypothetical protein